MTDIDWSKAPEWSDRFGKVRNSGTLVWFSSEKYQYCAPGGYCVGPFVFDCEDTCSRSFGEIELIATRPASEWTGEGLPPVGTVCEMRDDLGVWHRATVIANGVERGEAVGIGQADDLLLWCKADHHCRPIRTSEQIAAKEREKAYRGMIDDLAAVIGISNIDARECDALHALADAGYRKVEGGAP